MGSAKEFFLHKLSLRVIYIVGAYVASHVISYTMSQQFTIASDRAGVMLKITDPDKFQTYLTGLLLVGGEFIYRFLHTRFILPIVRPKE